MVANVRMLDNKYHSGGVVAAVQQINAGADVRLAVEEDILATEHPHYVVVTRGALGVFDSEGSCVAIRRLLYTTNTIPTVTLKRGSYTLRALESPCEYYAFRTLAGSKPNTTEHKLNTGETLTLNTQPTVFIASGSVNIEERVFSFPTLLEVTSTAVTLTANEPTLVVEVYV